MSDPVTRLNAALEGRYAIERELGEGGMAGVPLLPDRKTRAELKLTKHELYEKTGTMSLEYAVI